MYNYYPSPPVATITLTNPTAPISSLHIKPNRLSVEIEISGSLQLITNVHGVAASFCSAQ